MGHGTPAPAAVDHAAMGHGTPATTPAAVDHAAMGHGTPAAATPTEAVDHAAMGHGTPATPAAVDHAAMGHGTPAAATPTEAVDHAAMGHGTPATTEPMDHSGMDHGAMSGMDHAAMGHGADPDLPADAAPRTPIPALTDADRAAAFPPDAHGHEVHDQGIYSYWLVDRLEWQDADDGGLGWEGLAWVGGDVNRAWLRSEGDASDGGVESANAEVLYGRAVSPWWDVVAGVRHDFGEGPSRTYAAFGLQGLAPYKFEVELTAFVGTNGRAGATLEAEYDTLITNRLILQWQGEANLYVRDDPGIGVASGLSTIEAGARLRYEFSRRFAPYLGVEIERAFGGTADLRRVDGEATRETRLVAGIRFWF
ncbi:MAG: copper resistance protein B [Pseudomonadota bacterium]